MQPLDYLSHVALCEILHQQISFFTNFQRLIQHYLKKRFLSQIFLFSQIHSNPHPLNGQNLLSVIKVFCGCSLLQSLKKSEKLLIMEKLHVVYFQFCKKHLISETLTNSHWVPQGLVLRPLLFLIYINDRHQITKHAEIHNFEDDTNLLYLSKSLKDINQKINFEFK